MQTKQTWTHSIWLCSPQMPCDSHLQTGLADIRKGGHDHLHGSSTLVSWWGLSHGAGSIGDPGTPVKLKKKGRRMLKIHDETLKFILIFFKVDLSFRPSTVSHQVRACQYINKKHNNTNSGQLWLRGESGHPPTRRLMVQSQFSPSPCQSVLGQDTEPPELPLIEKVLPIDILYEWVNVKKLYCKAL